MPLDWTASLVLEYRMVEDDSDSAAFGGPLSEVFGSAGGLIMHGGFTSISQVSGYPAGRGRLSLVQSALPH